MNRQEVCIRLLEEVIDAGWQPDAILGFVPRALAIIMGSADGGERPAATDTGDDHVSASHHGDGASNLAAGVPPSTEPQDPTFVAWVKGHRQAGASPLSDQRATPAESQGSQHTDAPDAGGVSDPLGEVGASSVAVSKAKPVMAHAEPAAAAPVGAAGTDPRGIPHAEAQIAAAPPAAAQLDDTAAAAHAGAAEIPESKPRGWWPSIGRGHLQRFADERKTMAEAAAALKASVGMIHQQASVLGIRFGGRGGRRPGSGRPQRRFTEVKDLAPERVTPLDARHPAVVAGRTVFLKSVQEADDVERVFVSGQHSRKLGDRIIKGSWRGMPIYTLTLEERATCPTTCHHWRSCYGNGMPFARRHAFTPALIERLEVELALLNEKHEGGFAVRLHNLGDFPTVDYAVQWVKWLNLFERLHVFGYTAHEPSDEGLNQLASPIGAVIQAANRHHGDRWFIRFSSPRPGPSVATTIWRKPEGDRVKEGIVCPAQTGKTECCGTCALCWEPNTRNETIVFVAHGPKFEGRPPAATIDHVAANKLAAKQLPPDAPAINGHKPESTETREVLPKAVQRRCEACPATFNTRIVDQVLCLACMKRGVKPKRPPLGSGMGRSLA